MKDVSKLGTLFKYKGVLYETVSYVRGNTVIFVKPVRERDYKTCECGLPLPNQEGHYVLASPLLQDGIEAVYVQVEENQDD